MKPPRLIAISDVERGSREAWLEALEALLSGARPGSVLVLLRDRQLPIRERQELGRRLRSTTRAHGQLLSVSDRLDLAVLLEAEAVHLSEGSVDVTDARAFARALRRCLWISAACHAPALVESTRADAVLLSPVLAPRKGRPALGAVGLARALRARSGRAPEHGSCALYALGGVTHRNAGQLLQAGADGVALIGELFVPGAVSPLIRSLGIAR